VPPCRPELPCNSSPLRRTAQTETFRRRSPSPPAILESSTLLPTDSLAPAPGMPLCIPFARPPALVWFRSRLRPWAQPSPPTLIFVHPPIDNIQVSVVPPVNSPPPACPNQGPLPAACNLKFNPNAANYLPLAEPDPDSAGHRLQSRRRYYRFGGAIQLDRGKQRCKDHSDRDCQLLQRCHEPGDGIAHYPGTNPANRLGFRSLQPALQTSKPAPCSASPFNSA